MTGPRVVVLLAITVGSIGEALLYPIQKAEAQQALFLISPYYGSKARNSYFDHRYPTYNSYPNTTYPNVVIYTGQDSPSGNPYWYDGHDGYEFLTSSMKGS